MCRDYPHSLANLWERNLLRFYLSAQDFPEDALTAGGSRGSRAFSRRRKRHVALGLPGEEGDDRRQRR